MDAEVKTDSVGDSIFPGKIGHRSTVVMAFLLAGLLVGGGVSLYLASMIASDTNKIEVVAGKIEHVDHVHLYMDHLIGEINQALALGDVGASDRILSDIQSLQEHMRRYVALETQAPSVNGGLSSSAVTVMGGDISSLIDSVRRIEAAIRRGGAPRRQDLGRVLELRDQLGNAFLQLSDSYHNEMDRQLQANGRRMGLISAVYFSFLVLGFFGLVGLRGLVSKTIVLPIHNLAAAMLEVAGGHFNKRVPVTSSDEIGQLSYLFNVMAEKIRNHEEKLKGMVALEERERIAQELHDSLAQDLALIHLKVANAERELGTELAPRVRAILRDIRDMAANGYDDVRQAIFGLRTMVSKGLGLIPTLTEYLHDFSEQKGIPVELKLDQREAPDLPAQAEVQLIRIIHEALMNVFKHSTATRSEVRFEHEGGWCKVVVEDNGRGFCADDGKQNDFHFGLRTMKERAAAAGGTLEIDTAPDRGTRVIVYLPERKAAYATH